MSFDDCFCLKRCGGSCGLECEVDILGKGGKESPLSSVVTLETMGVDAIDEDDKLDGNWPYPDRPSDVGDPVAMILVIVRAVSLP